FTQENDCLLMFNLMNEIEKEILESFKDIDPQDITNFKKTLENYCDLPFNCHTAKKYWTKIEHE
ncbi:21030_t:CDS:1, partial [Gigaspora rosea]